jgi:N-acetylneuraminate synthase/N,N'-diacetyllegionaminate synthase
MDWLQKLTDGVFIIAEAGINHNGDMQLARGLVDIAAAAEVDAVKFQTYRTEDLLTADAPKAEYQKAATGEEESQFEMLKRCELSQEQLEEIVTYCKAKEILFISTPFEERSADLLESLDVPLFKIPSGEITNLPFLGYVARKGRPLIISTGMSYLGEVEQAMQTVWQSGCEEVALLHCTSNYPASVHDVNLQAMSLLKQSFKVPVGYSDHTLGFEIAVAAVALGARIIEKHFTIDRKLPGPDHQASLEPKQLKQLVQVIRNVEVALGDGIKQPAEAELSTRSMARKSLVFAKTLSAGTELTEEMVEAKRPGTGISPVFLQRIVGRRLVRNVEAGALISWEVLG